MSEVSRQDVIDWMNGEIRSLRKTIESASNMGWSGRGTVAGVNLSLFEKAIKLIEGKDKVTRKWVKGVANKIWLEETGDDAVVALGEVLREIGVEVEDKDKP